MRTLKNFIFFLSALVLVSLLVFLFSRPKEPIKIGFVTDLSGRKSQLGTMARNGVMMAIDEINNVQGGLKNRQIELLIRDHKGDKELCFKAITELAEQNVSVIIGPLNSSMVKTAITAAEKSKTLLISPTASTETVARLDDNFLRVNSSAVTQGELLADAVLFRKDKRIAIILDEVNIALTGAVAKGFKSRLSSKNSKIVYEKTFNNKSQFAKLAKEASLASPDALLVLASGIDAAGVVQQYNKIADLPNLYACMWSKTSIIKYGGKTVEGMILASAFESKNPSEKEIKFNRDYELRYQTKPKFISRYSYESVMIFAQAFNQSGKSSSDSIKAEIIKIGSFSGISDDFKIDKFGDAIRQKSLFIIKNGKYELLDINHE